MRSVGAETADGATPPPTCVLDALCGVCGNKTAGRPNLGSCGSGTLEDLIGRSEMRPPSEMRSPLELEARCQTAGMLFAGLNSAKELHFMLSLVARHPNLQVCVKSIPG